MAKDRRARIEHEYGVPLRNLLHQWYWMENESTPSIAEKLAVSPSGVRKWMLQLGVPRRDLRAAQATSHRTGRWSISNPINQAGSANHHWKGGRVRHKKGYILGYAPDHPESRGGYVLEHRLVAEASLGRSLRPDEDVHHRDGNKANNSPENLEVLGHAAHARLHRAEKAADHASVSAPA